MPDSHNGEAYQTSRQSLMLGPLPTATVSDRIPVTATIMVTKPRSLGHHKKHANIKREKIKEKEYHHQNSSN